MKNRNFVLAILVYLSLTVLLFSQQGPGGGRSPGGSSAPRAEGSGNPISVAGLSTRFNFISVAGRLQPRSRIVHKASVDGYIGSIVIEKGDFVAVGDHLFRIDRNDIGQSFKPVYVDARISGVVSEIDIQINSDISVGSPCITIIARDSFYAEALISDKDAFKIEVGQNVSGKNPDGLVIEGILSTRSQEPDYDTGLFNLSFHFPKKDGFYIGSFVLIDLPTDKLEGIFINRDLLIRKYGKYFIWAIADENKLSSREVEVGTVFADDIHIISGLNPGDKYLSRISGKETEGMEIKGGTK